MAGSGAACSEPRVGLKVNVASAALVAHFYLPPSNSHGSSAGKCGAAAEEADLDGAVEASSSVQS